MGSWVGLPKDLLYQIVELIDEHKDVVRFGAVCKPWCSIVMDNLHLLPLKLPLCLCLPTQRPLPLLMQCHKEAEGGFVDLFSVFTGKPYGGFLLPEINDKWIVGSSDGWLFTVEMHGQEIHLLNPLTRVQIPLPSLSAFQYPKDGFLCDGDGDFALLVKAVVSSDPSQRKFGDDCIVMAIISTFQSLSFCRLGDDKWTNVEGSPTDVMDVIPYRGQFYAVTQIGTLITCDAANGGNLKLIANGFYEASRTIYLVESTSGDLLLVGREDDYEETGSFTTGFVVYQLEAVDECDIEDESEILEHRVMNGGYVRIDDSLVNQRVTGFRWVELESLGDQVLFLGQNSSLCLPAQSVPGCKRNCIYFSDDYCDARHIIIARGHADRIEADGRQVLTHYDVGVYDMEDESVVMFEDVKDMSLAMPPVWVSPKLQ